MACPACGAVCAKPSTISAQADGANVVIIRCKQCGEESRFEVPASADPTHRRSGVRLPLAKPPRAKEQS